MASSLPTILEHGGNRLSSSAQQLGGPSPTAPTYSSSPLGLHSFIGNNNHFAASSETLIGSSYGSTSSPKLFSYKDELESPSKLEHDHTASGKLHQRNFSNSSSISSSSLAAAVPWQAQKSGSRFASFIKRLRQSSSGKCQALAAVVAVLLLFSILSISTPVAKHVASLKDVDMSAIKDTLSSIGSNFRSSSTSSCDDPFAMPGYIWYGKKHQDVRWIPYKYLDEKTISSPENAILYNPEHEKKLNNSANDEPLAKERLPLELSKMFKTYERREGNINLEFMRNKHVSIYGSSLDREMVKMFCNDHEHSGKQYTEQHHRHVYCHFEDYNFTISSMMHFGLHQSTWFRGDDDPAIGTQVENRLENVVQPIMEQFGKPDLLVFSTGLWDLMYFNKLARRVNSNASPDLYEPIAYERLEWHRSRLAEVINKLRQTYPGTPLLYRTTTQPAKKRGKNDDEMIAVFQLNQSSRALMKTLGVPIFHWPDLIKGSHDFRDYVHYNTESRQNWLYSEMLLYSLQAVSNPHQDTSCWMDR